MLHLIVGMVERVKVGDKGEWIVEMKKKKNDIFNKINIGPNLTMKKAQHEGEQLICFY